LEEKNSFVIALKKSNGGVDVAAVPFPISAAAVVSEVSDDDDAVNVVVKALCVPDLFR